MTRADIVAGGSVPTRGHSPERLSFAINLRSPSGRPLASYTQKSPASSESKPAAHLMLSDHFATATRDLASDLK